MRRANLAGVYDPHTNLTHYPKIMQPSHVKWEQVHESAVDDDENSSFPHSASTNGNLTNGDHAHAAGDPHTAHSQPSGNLFKPVPEVVARNLLVTDVYYESPPISNLGVPGPDGDVYDLGTNGLSDVTQEVLDVLPENCRAAFYEARAAELAWKAKWIDEHKDGARGKLRIGFNGFPV